MNECQNNCGTATAATTIQQQVKAKLQKAMEMVKRLEKELTGKKAAPKGAKSKGSKGEKKKKKKKAKGEAGGREKKKDKKKRKASLSPRSVRGGEKEGAGDRGRKKATGVETPVREDVQQRGEKIVGPLAGAIS